MRRFLISLIVLIAFVLAGTILSQRSYVQAQGPPDVFPGPPNSRVDLSVFCIIEPDPGAVFAGTFCLPVEVRGYIDFIRECHDRGGAIRYNRYFLWLYALTPYNKSIV